MVDILSYLCFNLCSRNGITKAVICAILSIKDLMLLIGKSNPCCDGIGFPLSLSEWQFTICLTPLGFIYLSL